MIAPNPSPVLPPMLELDYYRLCNADLRAYSDEHLIAHYQRFGEPEGRRSNSIATRIDFAALVPRDAHSLEIGPFYNPLLRGPNTKYFDRQTQAELISRAASLQMPTGGVPHIDFVSHTCDLTIVDETFDNVFSSHCIEHNPDLIGHLQIVERLLVPGGRYFVIAPDKRYCFDHYRAPSTIADVIPAHEERRTLHTLANVLGSHVLSTHNDCGRHWAGDHGSYMAESERRTREGLGQYQQAAGTYLDLHGWFFTPASAKALFCQLPPLGYTSLKLERLYPTRRDQNEFWFVLRKECA